MIDITNFKKEGNTVSLTLRDCDTPITVNLDKAVLVEDISCDNDGIYVKFTNGESVNVRELVLKEIMGDK